MEKIEATSDNLATQQSLAALKLTLDISPAELKARHRLNPWDLGPLLQGVLMERIDKDYAGYLHEQQFNPYAQYCTDDDSHLIWTMTALNTIAAGNVLNPLLDSGIAELFIRSKDLRVKIIERTLVQVDQSELTSIFYGKKHDSDNLITVRFNTPTAFKRSGRYVFYPDLRLVLQNLSMRYSAIYEGNKEPEEELLDLLERSTSVTSYQLRSQYFALGKARVPAFMGRITIKLSGAETLNNYARMLLRFGEFAGVGIKCSMGMGAMSVEQSSNGKARR